MSRSDKLDQRLARLKAERPALVIALRTAAYSHDVEGGNANDVLAAKNNLTRHDSEIERIENWSLPAAREQDEKDAEAARSAEERRIAEAEAAARLTNYNGAIKLLAAWRKAMAPVEDACSILAKAAAEAERIRQSLALKLPEGSDVPWDDTWNDLGRLPQRFIADELAAAADRFDTTLPGSNR